MACAFVQGTGLQSTGSVASLSKAYASPLTAGNLSVVGIIGNNGVTTPTFTGTPPSDGLGNTYAQHITYNGGNSSTRQEFWYAKNIAGGSGTVVVTPSGSSLVSIGIAEVSGADTTSPNGNTNSGTGTSTTPATASVTVATSGEIMFGILTHEGSTRTITKDAAFTEVFVDTDATEMPVEMEYKVVSANTAATWTLGTGAVQWEAIAASYKAATAAASPGPSLSGAAVPNRWVGPMPLRSLRRSPVPVDTTVAAPTDTNFGPPVRVPNNRVGPPVLRALYRAPSFMFDTTRIAVSGNRIRRVICSASDA